MTYGLVGYFAGSAAADAITSFGIYAAIALVVLVVGGYALRQGARAPPEPPSRAGEVIAALRPRGPPAPGQLSATVSRSSAQELMQ